MATYIKYEETVQIQYINVDIDYSLSLNDPSTFKFNGDYIKNNNNYIYFGLQDENSNFLNYLNNLSNDDLTNCIITSDNNYTIKLEKVDNTAAKIFVNKPTSKLTLDKRTQIITYKFKDNTNNIHELFKIVYKPYICKYSNSYRIYKLQAALKSNSNQYLFDKVYAVINFNGTVGSINIDTLKKAMYWNIDNTYINKTILFTDCYTPSIVDTFNSQLDKLIYTYYGKYFADEDSYKPTDLLHTQYDKIIHYAPDGFSGTEYKVFDYSNNKLVHYVQFVDKMIYLIAYDEYQDKVLPIYMLNFTEFNRKLYNDYTYTTYIYGKKY